MKTDYVVSGRHAAEMTRIARELLRLCEGYKGPEGRYLKRSEIPLLQQLAIDGTFLNWLSAYGQQLTRLGEEPRDHSKVDLRVQRALHLIGEHPLSQSFCEQELARQCGLSVNHLNRLFQQVMSVSPYSYFDRIRARRARYALEESCQQIKGIAYDLGFHSPAHFTTWFRRKQGCSPRKYRQQNPSRPES